jgi:hypothetical protein
MRLIDLLVHINRRKNYQLELLATDRVVLLFQDLLELLVEIFSFLR